jgi:hypothetical protein
MVHVARFSSDLLFPGMVPDTPGAFSASADQTRPASAWASASARL